MLEPITYENYKDYDWTKINNDNFEECLVEYKDKRKAKLITTAEQLGLFNAQDQLEYLVFKAMDFLEKYSLSSCSISNRYSDEIKTEYILSLSDLKGTVSRPHRNYKQSFDYLKGDDELLITNMPHELQSKISTLLINKNIAEWRWYLLNGGKWRSTNFSFYGKDKPYVFPKEDFTLYLLEGLAEINKKRQDYKKRKISLRFNNHYYSVTSESSPNVVIHSLVAFLLHIDPVQYEFLKPVHNHYAMNLILNQNLKKLPLYRTRKNELEKDELLDIEDRNSVNGIIEKFNLESLIDPVQSDVVFVEKEELPLDIHSDEQSYPDYSAFL